MDNNFSFGLGDTCAAIETQLLKTVIKHIPAHCFNQQQKNMVFYLVYEH
jgi:hypothetical protein